MRIVLEPRARTVDPEMLMGMLFRNSDLEIRFALNLNVLIDGLTPKVCSLKEVLRAFLDHRRMFCCAGRCTGWRRSITGLRCWKALSPPS